MKANFYIHGVPKGQDVWGSEQDRDYIKSFYSASYSESVRFVVELIPSKKRTFYTYIRSKNVYGSENREGSYFGMTVSFDGIYCTDNESLFTLFDTIFNKRIVGSVLQNQNGNYRFSVAAFEGKSKELESIQSEFLKQLDSFADDLENMDNSFTGSSNGQVAYYNVSDIDNSNFFAVLRKTLKVYISPEYPTKDCQIASLKKQVEPEKSKNKQLTDEKAELEAKLSAATDKNKRNETELSQLRQEKQQLEDDNKKLRQENASLKIESERNKSKKSIESSVNQIRQPLEDLVKHIRKAMPVSSSDEPHHHHNEPQQNKRNDIWSLVRNIVLIMILLLVSWLVCFESLKYFGVIAPIKVRTENKQTKAKPAPKPYITIQGIKDNEEMEVGKEYIATFFAQGAQIKWKVDGAEVPDEDKTKAQLKFKPLAGKDTMYLTGCIIVGDKETIIEKKKWAIKK